MTLEYKFLSIDDSAALQLFLQKTTMFEDAKQWVLNGLKGKSEKFVLAGEFVDGNLNGILAACTLSYWYGVKHELLPIWLGIRLDRSVNVVPFSNFISKITKLVSSYFENLNYYQFYFVKRLPKKQLTDEELSILTLKTWHANSYDVIVERVIKTESDYNNSPTTFQKMIGEFKTPVVILCFTLSNHKRMKLCH